jgi:hypothetical protein
MLQNEALNLLKMGKNIFLTGAAGAGKTFLLNQYIKYLKTHDVRVAITASTGIAATHIHGITIHAWSGIGVKEKLGEEDLANLLKNKRIVNNYRKTKVLIIDEISMLHKHYLDMVDTIARYIIGNSKPFGGLQVVLCGDFFQLPPVTTSNSSYASDHPNSSNFDKPFAFEATIWQEGEFQVCYLEEQHRQDDDHLLTILNDIRSGNAGEQTKVPLRTRYKKEPEGQTRATKLYSRNLNVDSINTEELAKIPVKEKNYAMTSYGFSALVENLKKNCLAPPELKLKLGAEVMFIKNDVEYGLYVNGTRGVVIGFDSSEDAWPIVKTYDNRIITANPVAWNFEDNDIVHASITQVPLRLAWAITIHKSQGMTLDAAEIDLGDAFEPGMGYVALSRVRSLSGLKLMNLNEMALRVHSKVLQVDPSFKENSNLGRSLLGNFAKEELEELHLDTLYNRFSGSKINLQAIPTTAKEKQKRKRKEKIKKETNPTHMISFELLKETPCIDTTASLRGLTSGTIINHIEKLKGLRLIDNDFMQLLRENIKDKIAEEDFSLIFHELDKSQDGKIKPIYEKLDRKYSFQDIQIVRLFI